MSNRDRYRETFSQLRSGRNIEWEDLEAMKKTRRLSHRWLVTAAAAAVLLVGLSVTAVAANFLGLRDLLLPGKGQVGVTDPETGVLIPGESQAVDIISLSGYMDSPESKALAEWQDFLEQYDPDHVILDQVGNTLDPRFDKYLCYTVYTQDMADRLEAIAAKYGLKLHTGRVDLVSNPLALGPLAGFAKDAGETYWTYMYEDGSCHFDGYAYVEGWGLVDVQFQRSVKGSLHDVTLNVGEAGDYRQWNYRTSSGVEVLLALGPGKSLIFADLPDCFAAFNVFQGTEGGMTEERLQAVADRYDFSLLSPVHPPETGSAEEGTDPRRAYAVILRNLLYGGTLPDGTRADVTGEMTENLFTVADVDGDGREELVVLYSTSTMAGMVGYVVGCGPETGEVHLELVEFPTLTFYDNGIVKAEASHNQTFGAMWPYALFVYNGETDSYDWLASAHADDRAVMEQVGKGADYPAQADTSGSGTVYTMIFADDPNTEVRWDKTQYDPWLAAVLGKAKPLELTYEKLTEENIAALLGGTPPVQTVPPEGMPKG